MVSGSYRAWFALTMIDSFIGGVLLWVDFNSLDLAVGNNDEAREQNSDNETKEPSSPKQQISVNLLMLLGAIAEVEVMATSIVWQHNHKSKALILPIA